MVSGGTATIVSSFVGSKVLLLVLLAIFIFVFGGMNFITSNPTIMIVGGLALLLFMMGGRE